jgi:membrane protein DedA with SNARE-associated domain
MRPLPPDLQALAPYLQTADPYIQHYGYWAVLLGILFEDFGLPAPGEALLISGALFASLGEFRIEWIILLGFLGAVTGDNIGYAIGHFGGRRLVVKYGRYVFLNEKRLAKLEGFFDRNGGKVVATARFIEGLRQFNGIVAAVSGMPWSRFLLFNILGAAIWVGFWGSAAYFFGSRLGPIISAFKRFEAYFIAALILLIVVLVVRRQLRNRSEDRSDEE